jgi:hypothetical protein
MTHQHGRDGRLMTLLIDTAQASALPAGFAQTFDFVFMVLRPHQHGTVAHVQIDFCIRGDNGDVPNEPVDNQVRLVAVAA